LAAAKMAMGFVVNTTSFRALENELRGPQNVPSMARVAAGAFGFLIFSHAFDGPSFNGAAFKEFDRRVFLK
jgi:hypothetical protein